MKRTLMLFIVFLLAACAKKGPEQSWPAKITAFDGLNTEQQAKLRQYVEDLNTKAGKDLVVLEGEGFPIHVSVVTAPANQPQRAGYSILSEDNCEIQISTFMLNESRADYLESVFLHEIGHCAGLNHTNDLGSIMYPTTARWATYSQQQISSFVTSFMDSVRNAF